MTAGGDLKKAGVIFVFFSVTCSQMWGGWEEGSAGGKQTNWETAVIVLGSEDEKCP